MGSAVMTQTMGKLLFSILLHYLLTSSSTGYQVAAQLFDYYAGMCDKIHGETSYPNSQGKYKILQREPIGVCSGIGAWNVSAVLFAWKAAPAIAVVSIVFYK